MNEVQSALMEYVKIVADEKVNQSSFDKTVKGVIISIDGMEAIVKINNENYTCNILNGSNIVVGDVVYVTTIQNNFSNKLILGKNGTSNGGGILPSNLATVALTGDYNDLINKPLIPLVDTYIFNQGVPSSQWIILHNLNKFPSVTIVDSANSLVIGDILYDNENQITINFKSGFSGKAFLN